MKLPIHTPYVQNMTSSKGNKVPDQFDIYTLEGRYFQSYSTVVAFISRKGEVTLDENWDYSRTTGRYLNVFLEEGIATTRDKIERGVYRVASLNPAGLRWRYDDDLSLVLEHSPEIIATAAKMIRANQRKG